MVEHWHKSITDENLSHSFKALSDITRRELLAQLIETGPMRVTDLAQAYDMSLNAISKHIKVLESANLVIRKQKGRIHWIQANLDPIEEIQQWLDELKSEWEMRLDLLEKLLTTGDEDNG
jgi:DNA-binding transcriptional ArsR family regulator